MMNILPKLSTGRVLGMVDQWWDFAYTVNDVFKQQGLDAKGCNYVPLGLTTEEGMENRWHTYDDTVNQASGVAITQGLSRIRIRHSNLSLIVQWIRNCMI